MAGPESCWVELRAHRMAVPAVVPFEEIEMPAPGKPIEGVLPAMCVKSGRPLVIGIDFSTSLAPQK